MGGSINGGTKKKWMVYFQKNRIYGPMDDLGVPPFQEISICVLTGNPIFNPIWCVFIRLTSAALTRAFGPRYVHQYTHQPISIPVVFVHHSWCGNHYPYELGT